MRSTSPATPKRICQDFTSHFRRCPSTLLEDPNPVVLRLFESVDDHAVSSYVCGGCPRAEHCTLRRFSVRGTSFVHQPSSTKMWTQQILRFQVLPLQYDSLSLRSVHEKIRHTAGTTKKLRANTLSRNTLFRRVRGDMCARQNEQKCALCGRGISTPSSDDHLWQFVRDAPKKLMKAAHSMSTTCFIVFFSLEGAFNCHSLFVHPVL